MTAGVVDDPELVKAIQTNANLFLAKPFDLDRVKLFVDRIIGQGAPMRREEDHSCSVCSVTGYESFDNQIMDKLPCERQAVMPSTTCSVFVSDGGQGEKRFAANILEISETGMCIRTEYQLKPGQLLRFSDIPVQSTGVVRWSKDGEAENSYRAGVQFIVPEGPAHRSLQQAQPNGDG
jgi:hypothetical protein